jgi:glutamine cyclotransferase
MLEQLLNKLNNMMLNKLLPLFFIFFIVSCKTEVKKDKQSKRKTSTPIKIVSPNYDTEFTIGDVVKIELQAEESLKANDIKLFVNDTLFIDNLPFKSQTVNIDTKNGRVGWVEIYLEYKDDNGNLHRDNRRLIFFSDVTPTQNTATIIKAFPHNNTSYTQGLEFYNGKLYESTGQKTRSMVAEVDLSTGNIIRKKDLAPEYFGEGITILNDTIYQITWQAGKCFMYDMEFNQIGEFTYEGEGWGLCNNGSSIIMTNGSSEIVWRNPKTFEIEKRIYVFEPETDVPALNEIELINGDLYANIYTKNNIVKIDTTTGKVLSYIDCFNVETEGRNFGDVLNGIAYDDVAQKIYITGKLWSKLFEVRFE